TSNLLTKHTAWGESHEMITTNIGKVMGLLCLAIGVSLIGVGCKGESSNSTDPAAKKAGSEAEPKAAGGEKLAGGVKIDGSSTVYPISEAVAEEFRTVQPDVRVIVGFSGTGAGMKKFIAGEIDICDASRGIKEKKLPPVKKKGSSLLNCPLPSTGWQ
ncbi:MAG: substrate-binding domain-containing protein, partial [Planctomycetota bacterium]